MFIKEMELQIFSKTINLFLPLVCIVNPIILQKKNKGDLDVSLDDNIEDEEYLKKLKDNILLLNKEKYDFVFYVAGVDIHLNDRLGKLKISEDGIKRRDEMIINNFFEKNIPICGVLGGGYNKDFETLVRLHAILHKTCASVI